MAISVDVRRLLLARSGGYCANPDCPDPDLFPRVDDEHVPTVAEMAHVIAQSSAGPRGDEDLPASERDQYENLVLLCPRCHDLVDNMKLTGIYTVELLRRWKERLEERIQAAVGARRFSTRADLNEEVAALLRKNHGIFRNYGPESAFADDPLSDAPETWRKLVRQEILPTNREILKLLDANRALLAPEELELVEDFRAHVFGFAENHLSGERRADVPRFPSKMNKVFS
jgi:5-methylcytosine-specific restriction endonuclease McrA